MSSLTDRYLAATLRAAPAARREEIVAELRAAITDAVEDRTGAGQDPATAERDVLTELGNPERLAARYADQRLQLIGPAVYLAWRRLLRVLLTFVPALVGTVVALVEAATGAGAGAIGSGITTALSVAVQICFWVTLTFAILERTGTAGALPEWTVDQLPEDTAERSISLPDTVAAIVGLLFALIFLPWQHLRSSVTAADGENIPLLDPALWDSWLPVLAAVLLASIIFELVKYRIGRWSWRLVAVTAALNLAFGVPTIWLLLTERLLNPALVQRFEWLREGDNLATASTVAAVSIAAIMVWDTADKAVKTYRQR
ncbi:MULTISPECIES: permease prefix domain 1-containing protein [Micromonospora]|uniref:Uncharacterized protein n=1 Tax=Micromonospora yangpuensis TaxID=683228 RepID=A0A1C6UHP7_9ACTN|nr:permease prefix domain 1-containing protein [Micromonospora yangpuensis]GGM03671.1 hypothetical protein GCM10012279_21750 [Micromonospora yangpuensis]SCL53615.1 hypothetical protein GA0070617_2417 [Micromonospora yangpuensis]